MGTEVIGEGLTRGYLGDEAVLYDVSSDMSPHNVRSIVASTPETRAICNDPFVTGVRYTKTLSSAVAAVLKGLRRSSVTPRVIAELRETETVVTHILRGGLNFGIRDALADAYGWNSHPSAFLSAQRQRTAADSEEWQIVEDSYCKIELPPRVTLVLGDVVATGTSLLFGLNKMIDAAFRDGAVVEGIVVFTIGGRRTAEIVSQATQRCMEQNAAFKGSCVVYFEGCFAVPDTTSPLSIRLTGTDLVRRDSVMAPEFVESQYEDPAYPLERCTIYDAGSRAFWLPEYLSDVREYWEQVLEQANAGRSFEELIEERFPGLDVQRFGRVDLRSLCDRQIERCGIDSRPAKVFAGTHSAAA